MEKSEILICLVVYNELIINTEAYRTLINNNLNHTFVYDNSSNPINASNRPPVLKYYWDKNNSGLSMAYNYMAVYAREKGYKWLLLCDQDTTFPKDILSYYTSTIDTYPQVRLIIPKIKVENDMFMSPTPSFSYFTKLSPKVPEGWIEVKKFAVINSGMCVNIDTFFEVGGYNTNVRVDFADFQFIERFSKYYNQAFVIDCMCQQSFSNCVQTINQKLKRYEIFCLSLKGYKPIKPYRKPLLTLLAFKRAVSLVIESKSLQPIKIFYKKYIR